MDGDTPPAVLVRIEDLTEHPRQAELFGDTGQLELKELADDIAANGLREPPTVLPDGTIVCGHRRVQAYRLLGRAEIPAVIDHGLAAQGAGAVERRLIEDNVARRQLDALSVARCYKRLAELERGGGAGRLDARREGELRERIGARFGVSGRTVSRYLRALATPTEVQHAVSAGRLTLAAAGKVAGLPTSVRLRIAAEIREGGEPAGAVKRHTAPNSGRHKTANDAFAAFVKGLGRGLDDLGGREKQVGRLGESEVATLRRSREVIGRLLARARKRSKEDESLERKMGEMFGDAGGDVGYDLDEE